jgi:small conductance mechanosensitive channel
MRGVLTPQFLMLVADKTFRIVVILLCAFLLLRFVRLVVSRFFIPQIGSKPIIEEKRARTLRGLVQSIIRYVIYFFAGVLILQEFNIDTTSIIAGAGVVGLALGVGAQSLIKDFITGFFIILEDQFAVGEYIVCGDMAGTVEDIGFRVTKLRDGTGVLHVIPHGAITRITNYSRGYMQAVINVPVAYEANLEKVISILKEVCGEIAAQEKDILEGPEVLGVVEMNSRELVIRLVAKTVPLKQGQVETVLRQRIKVTFDEAKIPPPNILELRSRHVVNESENNGTM